MTPLSPLILRHRINTSKELSKIPRDQGVEIDLRSEGKKIILQHDPFTPGELFSDWLKGYRHSFLVLNTKTDGMEDAILSLLKKRGIRHYFFLDLALPTLIRLGKKGLTQNAVRFSEYEPLETCLRLRSFAEWVWIDCFQRMPLTPAIHPLLAKNFKLCLVSPELQHHSPKRIVSFKKQLKGLPVNAICTKFPALWVP